MSLPHARPLVLLFLCCLVLVGANFQVRVPQRHTNVHPKLVSYTNTHTEFIEEEEQLKESAPVLFAPTTTAPLTNNNNNHNVLNAHNKVTRHNNKHSHSHHHHRNNNNDDEVPIEMRVKNMDSILSKAEAVLRSLTGLPLLQQQQQPLQPQPQPQPKQQQEQPRQQQQQEQQQPQQPPPQPQQQQQQQQQPLSTSSGPATISQTSPTSTSSVSPPATAAPASPAASSASAVVTHAELAESVSEKKRQTHPSQPAQIALGESEAEHGIAPPPVTHTKVFPPPPSSSSSPSTPSSPASPSTATSLSSSSSTPSSGADHDEAAEAGAKPKSDDDDDDEEDDKETVGKALDSEMKMSGSVCAGRYEHFYFDMPSCNLSSYLVIIKPQDNGACALVDWADVYFKNGSIANADDYDVMTSLPSGETSTYLRFVTPQPPSSRFYIAVRGTDSLSSPCNFQIDIKFGPDVCVTPKEPLHFCSMVDYPVLNEDIFQSDFLQMKDAYVKTKFDVLALRSEGRCIDATKNFLCSVNFQRCNPHGLALRPCRSVCDEYAESCSLDSVAFDPSDPEKPGCPTDKYADVECTKADPVSLEEAV